LFIEIGKSDQSHVFVVPSLGRYGQAGRQLYLPDRCA
jgi:hypothetical protein